MKHLLSVAAVSVALLLASGIASAQDAAKIDPKHYKVEFENEHVRVLRITYGPNEKSAMHSHPEGVVVFLTDGKGRFTLPDGTTQDNAWKSGDVRWMSASTHQPENTGRKSFSLIQIEIKSTKE